MRLPPGKIIVDCVFYWFVQDTAELKTYCIGGDPSRPVIADEQCNVTPTTFVNTRTHMPPSALVDNCDYWCDIRNTADVLYFVRIIERIISTTRAILSHDSAMVYVPTTTTTATTRMKRTRSSYDLYLDSQVPRNE